MGNPYYIPGRGAGVMGAVTTGLNLMQAKQDATLKQSELALRQRVSDAEYGTPGSGQPGLAQQRIDVQQQGNELEQAKLTEAARSQPADMQRFAPSNVMMVKTTLDNIGLEAPTLTNSLFSYAKTGASRGEVYDAMKQNWPVYQEKTIGELQKQWEKKTAADPTYSQSPEGKRHLQLIDAFAADTDGQVIDGMFGETLQARQARATASRLEMMKAEKDPKLYETTEGFLPADQAIGKAPLQKGMVIESDGKGGFTIRTNADQSGAGMLTKPVQTDVQKEIIGLNEERARLAQIAKGFDKDLLTYQGAAKNLWAGLKSKVDVDLSPEERAFKQKYATFAQDTIQNANLYIKRITGAQMSEAEASRLMQAVPNMGDDPAAFKAKMENLMQNLNLAQARYTMYLKSGVTGEQLATMINANQAMSIEQVKAAVQKRGAELSKAGKSRDEIRQTLANEFGI